MPYVDWWFFEKNSHDKPIQKEKDIYVLRGTGRDILSALWTGLEAGTTGARDIQMKFKDDKEMCISSTLLSNIGEYFQVMLDCGLRETQENKVTFPTVTQSTFTHLMAFTLGQTVKVGTREDVIELLEAAAMMQIQSLMDACTELLQNEINANNCLQTFVMMRRFRPNTFQVDRALSLVVQHATRVLESNEWCSLEEEDISILLKTLMSSKSFRGFFQPRNDIEIFDAILRWIEINGEDQDTATRLLGFMEPTKTSFPLKNLPDDSRSVKNPSVLKAVQEWVKPEGEITLLVVGSADSKGDDCTDSYIYCWSENRQDWYVFPNPPKALHKDFAVTKSGNTMIISGGMNEKTGPSNKLWAADESGWREIGNLPTPRSRHGMAAIGEDLYIAGGLPGPLKSIEVRKKMYGFSAVTEEVGTLPEAVYDCAVAAVKERLLIVGGCSSEGPRNIIQTFHTVSRAAQVITLPESPGLQLDLGFTRYLGTLDSLLFLSRCGHLLEVKMEDDDVSLQSQVLLKDFHHQSPFAAVLDSGGVVVCDSRSADCRYSLDGEKKEETTVVRGIRDDIQVHSIFRFFLPSEKSPPPRHDINEYVMRRKRRGRRQRYFWAS